MVGQLPPTLTPLTGTENVVVYTTTGTPATTTTGQISGSSVLPLLAEDTGATLIGTSSGNTVQQQLNAIGNYTAPYTNAVSRTQASYNSDRVSVKDFGATGNGAYGQATSTTTSAAITVSGVTFTSADVGKAVVIFGAGAGGATLSTSIASVSGGVATLAATPGTAVSAATMWYGTDDTAACQAALASGASTVLFPYGTYMVQTLGEIPAGVTLQGDGWSHNSGAPQTGTRLQLITNASMFTVTGISTSVGGPQKSGVCVNDLVIDGSNFTTDLMIYTAASYCYQRRVFATNCGARLVYALELFDSGFRDIHYEWGGNSSGSLAMVSLAGGVTVGSVTYGVTNSISFIGCRFESIPGTCIDTPGNNVNNISFIGTKIESAQSALPLLNISYATFIRFSGLQLAQQGPSASTIPSMISFSHCQIISGDIQMSWISGGAAVATYVNFVWTQDVILDVVIQSGPNPTSGALVQTDGNNGYTFWVNCKSAQPVGTSPYLAVQNANGLSIFGLATPPFITFSRSDVAGSYWNIGELLVDGSGTDFRIMNAATPVLTLVANNVVQVSQGALQIGTGNSYIHSSSSAPTTNYQGNLWMNPAPSPGGILAWMSTVSGTPGTATPIYGEQVYSSSQSSAFTPDYLSQGSIIELTMTGNVAIANPATATDGRHIRLVLIQDSTGGWVPTFGTQYGNLPFLGTGAANQIGVLDLHCTVNGGTTVWNVVAWSGWSTGAPRTNVVVLTSSGTYTQSPGLVEAEVIAVGAGGGGGGGALQVSGSVASGGGGGGGGAWQPGRLRASDITTSVTVTVGAGGTGGLAATTSTTAGGTGGTGGNTTFGSYMTAYGGAGGAGGQLAAASGGGGGSGLSQGSAGSGGTGGSGGIWGGAGGSGNTGGYGQVYGGAGGGGCNSAGTPYQGSGGGTGGGGAGGGVTASAGVAGAQGINTISASYSPAGAIATNGGAGGTPKSPLASGGSGGTGGGGAFGANAGSGGSGTYGSGGGGGGSANNGHTAGAGGTGGSGYVIVIEHF